MRSISAEEFRNKRKFQKTTRGDESRLQEACVNWFRLAFPRYRSHLISIPNSGASTASRGAVLKKEGLMPGASDLFLFVPRRGFCGLAIEMKTPSGVLASHQLDWGVGLIDEGYLYEVCRDFNSFRSLINLYLL